MTQLPGGVIVETTVTSSGNQAVRVFDKRPVEPPRPVLHQSGPQFYIPHTKVHPATVAGAPADAVWVDVSSSDVAYFGALWTWWEEGESFAILEHDVICRPDVVEAFDECPEPWCVFGYADICHPECMGAWANELGCTRFRSEVIDAVPDAVGSIPRAGWDWHNLCDGLGANLRAAGFTHHWHFPPVEHHHMGRNGGTA